ncbi:MAG: hypothetical protein FWD92_01930 [Methanomassiliicoccaceae archaeon]|nr:hypothetical protein [Methanomassiliicoccaceae archaeon]
MGKRRWKDRRDGYYLYDADPLHKFMPHLMPKRTECEVFLKESIDVTEVLTYLEEKKAVDGNNITMFSLLMSTIVRVFALRPNLNNFIAGRRLYRRKSIDIGFVVKRELSDAGEETVVRIIFDPSLTIFEISDKLYAHVNEFRSSEAAGVDGILKTFSKMPRFMVAFIVSLLRILSYFGRVPRSITDSDPNHASAFVANMGSLKANAPFHHLSEWGTNSLFITVGAITDAVCAVDGVPEVRKCIDLAFTVDERIADGYYFMTSIKLMKDILSNPSVLEAPFVPEAPNDSE